jgi:soluble lytic murein transglycosylase-like protein
MQSKIVFCNRCRGMKVGWNKRYILHWLRCKQWFRNPARLGGIVILAAALLLGLPDPNEPVFSSSRPERPEPKAPIQTSVAAPSPAVLSMDAFLKFYGVREGNRRRLAESIVTSAKRYDVDPRVIASVMIVESRGNPFAISDKDAIGIMQIHLPTWGYTADREGINLFKIEDNVDFGARILKNYIRQFGLWQGVKRYNGFFMDDPASEQSAEEYVAKVQRVYHMQQSEFPQSALLE